MNSWERVTNSRERIRLALDHRESDHVPLDLGETGLGTLQVIEALAPGGRFVFAALHEILANVPSENIVAMWEDWKTYGVC